MPSSVTYRCSNVVVIIKREFTKFGEKRKYAAHAVVVFFDLLARAKSLSLVDLTRNQHGMFLSNGVVTNENFPLSMMFS